MRFDQIVRCEILTETLRPVGLQALESVGLSVLAGVAVEENSIEQVAIGAKLVPPGLKEYYRHTRP